MKVVHPHLLACALGAVLSACGSVDGSPASDGLDDDVWTTGSEEIRSTGSPPWVYTGPLPALENPKIVVSLSGHTARVTGALPEGWTGVVPYYASVETVAGRRVLTVVYPIATGASASLDSQERTFTSVTSIPFRPNGMAYPSTGPAFVTWGGFPFIGYNNGIAFHGPITWVNQGTAAGGEQMYDWYLQRGPVSHGCNRMQGEHVVELAHLLGYNMRSVWPANIRNTRRATVQVMRDYDRLPSGEAVDVDYPRHGAARAPTGPRRVFPTWNAEEMPRLVCADMRAMRTTWERLPTTFCDAMPANARDLATGNPVGPVVVDNPSSAFRASEAFARYTRNPIRVGSDYLAADAGRAGTATWQLPVTAAGSFRVWVRYAPDTNRNTRVSYQVFADATDASGQRAVVLSQRDPGQQGWVLLGTYSLRAGAKVVLTAQSTSDGYTIADAVRVEPSR